MEAQLSIMRRTASTCHRLGAIKLSDNDPRKLGDEIEVTWVTSQIPDHPIRLKFIELTKFSC